MEKHINFIHYFTKFTPLKTKAVMLIRFIAENFLSLKGPVEFNMLPSSKSHAHDNHKTSVGCADILRYSAIYGANGSGKSNLIKGMDMLKSLVTNGTVFSLSPNKDIKFKFSKELQKAPTSMAVEFSFNNQNFYYQIEFDNTHVYREELLQCLATTDKQIFLRTMEEGKISLVISPVYCLAPINKEFINTIILLQKQENLFLTFAGQVYPQLFPVIKQALDWFNSIDIITPVSHSCIPHILDTDSDFKHLVNRLLPTLGTGVSSVDVRVEELNIDNLTGNLKELANSCIQHPGYPMIYYSDDPDRDSYNIVYEESKLLKKTCVTKHELSDNSVVDMSLASESDGTKRLLEFMPLLYYILHLNRVYVVDEIERSLHPVMVKQLMQKLSKMDIKGQLIFSTHESCLLDQDIFRPDEIWLVQKDAELATQMYPLSEYNIHKTANIENGYLNGRYGGIPFLSNLNDLNWV